MFNDDKKLKILHLSDLHWHKEAQAYLRIVRDALLNDLKNFSFPGTQEAFDILLFSGDMVRGGGSMKISNLPIIK